MAGPGQPRTGGRAPGKLNKATVEFRETITKLLSDNAANVELWLAAVAKGKINPVDAKLSVAPDPGRALDLMTKLAEYAAPKLSRSEVSANVTVKSHEEWVAELGKR